MNFKQIRKRNSYRKFDKFLTFAGPQKNNLDTLMALYNCINRLKGFGSNQSAVYAREAALVLFVDKLPMEEVPQYINHEITTVKETAIERLRIGR